MAEENVQKLLDMLYEMIDEAKNAPLSNDKCVLNRDEALDLLDEIRAQMPVELKRAQELVRARDEYVEAAKRDVERMMQKAEFEAKSKVSDSEVLYAAKEKARKIIADAEDRSRQLCQVANEYAEDALARTEEAVQAALTEVKQSRSAFRAASGPAPGSGSRAPALSPGRFVLRGPCQDRPPSRGPASLPRAPGIRHRVDGLARCSNPGRGRPTGRCTRSRSSTPRSLPRSKPGP